MKSILLKAGQIGIALIFVTALTGGVGRAQSLGGPTIWTTYAESFNAQTDSGSSMSSSSEQQSSDGQGANSNETHTENEDGSTDEHDEHNYDDGKGEDGLSGSSRTDSHRNPDGTWKVHHEEIVRENGKCEIVSWDDVYDKDRHLIKKGERKSKPCDLYGLEVKYTGHEKTKDIDITWGPNVVIIPLQRGEDDHFQGQVGSNLTYSLYMSKCSGLANILTNFEVTAVEDRLSDTMEITATTTQKSVAGFFTCGSASNMVPGPERPRTFQLPAEEGATKVFSASLPGGNLTTTYTLRVYPQGELGPDD